MDYAQPFSVLNERLRPRMTTSEQLHSSLSRLEERQLGSPGSKARLRAPTPAELEPDTSSTGPEDPEEMAERDDSVCDSPEEGSSGEELRLSALISELGFQEEGEFEEEAEEAASEDSGSVQSEGKDSSGEGTGGSSESVLLDGEGGGAFQRSYCDGTLPDLIRSGRPLGRRRTLGHVSDTLKEVRREVELSRRRSIKLKAQVDRLQESRAGPGWGLHRERVTEEVLSILRLLHPLTDPDAGPREPADGESHLDAALGQLQAVARKLAIRSTQQEVKSGKGGGGEDGVLLQQALRDRDEAIDKKKAMEAELLRSKTELMMLNNQLLEAVQKRLEMSLELEAWKDDVQLILQQQVLSQQQQQQQQQQQKKSSRGMGLLRRNKQPPIQRPANFPSPAPATPAAAPAAASQIYIIRTPAASPSPDPSPPPSSTPRTWRDKLRRGKNGRQGDQDAAGRDARLAEDDGFHAVSLD